ncbi:MAG: aminotransferase [Holophagales bacterium]|nr:aminotransferase [Holophagales bacterium]MYG30288.1 aminotransferase [Holophagales bacterium]MYI80969.1 aminotransferase [Holophagales bacterium]
MKNPPEGWPRISSSLFYDDAAAAIDWLVRAFGFEVQERVEDEQGRIVHSQLVLDGGLIMVGQTGLQPDREYQQSPRTVGGVNTQSLAVYVDDADAHCERARAAGAGITVEPATQDYGEGYWVDRSYGALDLEGHHWWFLQRLR